MQNIPLFGDVAPLISHFPRLMPLDAEGCATRGHFGSIAQPLGRAVLALHATLAILALAALFVADSHAPAQKKTIVAAARQAGVVLETGGKYASR